MRLRSLRWKWILIGILVAGILLWSPIRRIVLSVRLAHSLHSLALGGDGGDLPVKASEIQAQKGDRVYRALVYYPMKSQPTRAVILVAGLSELGCRHPRLIAFSRYLADLGLMVVAPDIPEYRDFQLTATPITQILFWRQQISVLKGGSRVRDIGIAGISFSGTIALMAASNPEINRRTAFVAAIGPYFDLTRCAGEWFSGSPDAPAEITYGGKFYAKWIIMRAALDIVTSGKDRAILYNVLDTLLRRNKVLPADPDLTEEGRRWYELATMPGNRSDPELSEKIENHLISTVYPPLNPEKALKEITCPLFIMHGAEDELIPSRESLELHRRLPRSYLLVTPLIGHTHPAETPLPFRQKMKALWDMAYFSFHLSKVLE
jgi:pimeloyl-ACP methyl ester carboxylesterase